MKCGTPSSCFPCLTFSVSFDWLLLILSSDRMSRKNRICCVLFSNAPKKTCGRKDSERSCADGCLGFVLALCSNGQGVTGWLCGRLAMLDRTNFNRKGPWTKSPACCFRQPPLKCSPGSESVHDVCLSIPSARRLRKRAPSRRVPVVPPSSRERTRPLRTST